MVVLSGPELLGGRTRLFILKVSDANIYLSYSRQQSVVHRCMCVRDGQSRERCGEIERAPVERNWKICCTLFSRIHFVDTLRLGLACYYYNTTVVFSVFYVSTFIYTLYRRVLLCIRTRRALMVYCSIIELSST